ncbi:MAG TPA: hypothetical protein VE954_33525 [Oligoflexus sp.]|uniref:hypothetical protein n=1 Tax=Oligoflexus sp. TaxID=1971216 RepID=UPI002D29AFA9|nr:hypothetical protein [Oligoflexus sp.]HYX38049.1 hypothetical protein [Oligoflexus sp.]
MTAAFAIFSACAAAALVLMALRRYVPSKRDVRWGLWGYLAIFLVTAGLGLSGILADVSRMPPPFLFFVLALLVVSVGIAMSAWGGRVISAVPLRVLIGLQGFRILPEILLDLAWREGLAPVQMTWHGRNFDIVSALSALLLFALWPRLTNPKVWAWLQSILAFGLLVNIVSVAVLSAPLPFRVFMNEPANRFVAFFPYIWLPGVHVLTALILHGLTFRRLAQKRP